MTMTLAALDIAAHVRDITDEEVAFYLEHGWVKLVGLTTPEFAGELLKAGEAWHERNQKSTTEWNPLALSAGVEPFRSLVFSAIMGRNAQRLMDRKRLSGVDVGVRYRVDHFVCKAAGSPGASYHQDTTEHGTDRAGEVQFWLALAEATPEMGTMRFLPGVQREGPLGSCFAPGDEDLLKRYPRLTDLYPMTEPIQYRPGDATVHHGFMVHGSGPNQSDRSRMSYIYSYTPADARWWNGQVGNWGSQRLVLSDERNPLIATMPQPPPG
jgi:hypothetical protein